MTPPAGAPATASVPAAAQPARVADQILISEQDIVNRRYVTLGDISVTVRKWGLLDADPTREHVARALREKAAELGADAVIFVRYGTVGIGFFSWGQMDGQGRAIRFE